MYAAEAREAREQLLEEAEDRRLAIMCAEIVPWRCHRRIVSDHLVAAGARVVHILKPGQSEEHELDEMARILKDGRVAYPPEQASLDL